MTTSENTGRLSLDRTVAQLVAEEPPAEGFEIIVVGSADGRYAQIWDASPEEEDTALIVWITDDPAVAAEEPPAAEAWGGAYGMVDRDTGRVAFPFTAFVWEEDLDDTPDADAIPGYTADSAGASVAEEAPDHPGAETTGEHPTVVAVTFYEASDAGDRARPGDRLTRSVTLTLPVDPTDREALHAAVRNAADDETLDAVQARIGDVVVVDATGDAWAIGPDELTPIDVEIEGDGESLEVKPTDG